MKWIYSIKNKLFASVVLFSLCLLVLLSHNLNRAHTQNVTNSIATLYEDRLIAEDYILKMTSDIYQIREVLNTNLDFVSKFSSLSKLIDEFNDQYNAYSKTKLTRTEEAIANELKSYIRFLEQNVLNNKYAPFDYTDKALFSLNELSTVQLEESKLILENAESEYITIKASSQFAFAIIIIILLVVHAMIYSSKTLVPVGLPATTS